MEEEDFPENTRPFIDKIKNLFFVEKKTEKEIAEMLNLDELDVIDVTMILEMDDATINDPEPDVSTETLQLEQKTKDDDFELLSIIGAGGEIVIGTLEENAVATLLKVGEENVDEEKLEEIVGRPWSEVDDIWHFYGPFEEFRLENKEGKEVECNDSLDWDWEDVDNENISHTKKSTKSLWELELKPRFLLICINGEKGTWGNIQVPKGFKKDELLVINDSPEFDTEYNITLGFSYKGSLLPWDEDGETVGSFREFRIFDVKKEEVVLTF